jgi:hypothetical protein
VRDLVPEPLVWFNIAALYATGTGGRSDQRYRLRLSAATGPLDDLGVLLPGVPRARRLDVLDLLAPLGRALAVGGTRLGEVPAPGQMTPPRGGRS